MANISRTAARKAGTLALLWSSNTNSGAIGGFVSNSRITPDACPSSSQEFDRACLDRDWKVLESMPEALTTPTLNNLLKKRSSPNPLLGPFESSFWKEPSTEEIHTYQAHLAKWTAEYGVALKEDALTQLAWNALLFIRAIAPGHRSKDQIYLMSDLMAWAILFDDGIEKAYDADMDLEGLLTHALDNLEAGLDGTPPIPSNDEIPFFRFAAMAHWLGTCARDKRSSKRDGRYGDGFAGAVRRTFVGLCKSLCEGAPMTPSKHLERHAGWDQNLSYVMMFLELGDLLDGCTLRDEDDADAQEKLKAFSIRTSECIVLSNNAMAAKDMLKADESYLALLIRDGLASSSSPVQVRKRFSLDGKVVSDRQINEWIHLSECYDDMSDVTQQSAVLSAFLPTPLGFGALRVLNSQVRESFRKAITDAKTYAESGDGNNVTLRILNRLRWCFFHHVMAGTIGRYGDSFSVYKSCAIDNDYDEYIRKIELMKKK